MMQSKHEMNKFIWSLWNVYWDYARWIKSIQCLKKPRICKEKAKGPVVSLDEVMAYSGVELRPVT